MNPSAVAAAVARHQVQADIIVHCDGFILIVKYYVHCAQIV